MHHCHKWCKFTTLISRFRFSLEFQGKKYNLLLTTFHVYKFAPKFTLFSWAANKWIGPTNNCLAPVLQKLRAKLWNHQRRYYFQTKTLLPLHQHENQQEISIKEINSYNLLLNYWTKYLQLISKLNWLI